MVDPMVVMDDWRVAWLVVMKVVVMVDLLVVMMVVVMVDLLVASLVDVMVETWDVW